MASVLLLVGVPALLVAGVTRRGEPDEAEWTDDAPVDAARDEPVVEVPRPRTVAELVALRERQVTEAANAAVEESATVEESGTAEESATADESATAEESATTDEGARAEKRVAAEKSAAGELVAEPPADDGNVVQLDRRRRRT
jgi:hypothetical protein